MPLIDRQLRIARGRVLPLSLDDVIGIEEKKKRRTRSWMRGREKVSDRSFEGEGMAFEYCVVSLKNFIVKKSFELH